MPIQLPLPLAANWTYRPQADICDPEVAAPERSVGRVRGPLMRPFRSPVRRLPTTPQRIDAIHLEHPFAGSRMLRDMLCRGGFEVGRRHVATLMQFMGIEALYRKPNTSKKHPGHTLLPCLLRGLRIERADQSGPTT